MSTKPIKYLIATIILIVGVAQLTPVYSENHAGIDIKPIDLKANGEYVRKQFLLRMKKPFKSNGGKKVLIIGDSHAQDFLNSVYENNYLKEYQISTRYIPTRCQIFLAADMNRLIKPEDKELCSKSDNLLQAKEQINEADIIILVAFWRKQAALNLSQTIKNLGLSSQQKLLVIGRKSFLKVPINRYKKLPKKEWHKLRNKVDAQQFTINQIMKNTLSKDIFINYQQLVCGANSSCPVFTDNLKLISLDGGHLSKDGARYTGKLLFLDPLLNNLK